MSNDNLVPFDAEHQAAWALLPWYCNRTLATFDMARIESHLRGCLVCRREVEMLKVLAQHTITPRAGAECEAALRRLALRLDRVPPRPRQFPWAAAAMLALSTSMLAWASDNADTSTAWLRNAGYSMVAERALDETATVPLGPQVNLVFYDDITERELRSLVLAVGAVVVEGPTPQGVYTLAFARQMSPGEVMDALRQLRYSRGVLFAEPATTTKVSRVVDW
jgi:hypothetical protein